VSGAPAQQRNKANELKRVAETIAAAHENVAAVEARAAPCEMMGLPQERTSRFTCTPLDLDAIGLAPCLFKVAGAHGCEPAGAYVVEIWRSHAESRTAERRIRNPMMCAAAICTP